MTRALQGGVIMCGIAGIIGSVDERNRSALERMNRAMAHRGPDGAGIWTSTPDARGWGALLGHRRLAILDLTDAGAQPMVDPRSGQAIVFNGEIYNFRSIRELLARSGEAVASTGDTEVLLRALVAMGLDALPRLRGMFAFAHWDPAARQLTLVRDPLGIKPLYVARNPDEHGGWSIAFASELRALLASGLLQTPRLDPAAVASVVWNGFVVGPHTAVRGVELLPAGSYLRFGVDGAQRGGGRFWQIPAAPPAHRRTEPEVEAALEESLRLHLTSDVPLAIFLSSGVDSTAVANLAQRVSGDRVHTFTLAFESASMNEGPWARRIAEAIGSAHHEVVLTEHAFVENLEAAVDSLDQPTFDGLNAYYMSLAIRRAGFKVALVGTGGDELFGGYRSFRDLPLLASGTGWLPRSLRQALGATSGGLLGLRARSLPFPPQTRWAKLGEMIRSADDLLSLYQLAYALFLPDTSEELLDRDFAGVPRDGLPAAARERILDETARRSPLSALSVMETRLFLGERLLRDNDVASMAASIEQRLPLVDQELFAAVDAMTDSERYEPVGAKAVLRRIGLRGLPPELFQRPKQGFELPYAAWMRRGLRGALDAALLDPAAVRAAGLEPKAVERLWRAYLAGAPGLYWSRIWAIFVLVRWCARHGVAR